MGAAEKCVQVLSDLVKTRVNYVVQESVIVIKDIFRRYPRKYEKIIVTLCDNLESLNEPEAKASMIWIIGEYAERIVDAGDRLKLSFRTCSIWPRRARIIRISAIEAMFIGASFPRTRRR